MSDFKNSQTAQNLMKAFAGESQARNRYTYYAGVAKKQGFLQIANIFLETAENEKEHAKVFFKKLLEHGMNEEVVILNDAGYPVALTDDTFKNLNYAASGENEEWTLLYPSFADTAEKEGYKDVAVAFRMIAKVEEQHELRYRNLAKNVSEHQVFKKDGKVFWKCLNCGYVTENIEAPDKCPACQHPQSYFEIHVKNY